MSCAIDHVIEKHEASVIVTSFEDSFFLTTLEAR
jgi:hypothetical protein